MNCADFDWKAYTLGELSAAERELARSHAQECASCGEELERLQLTMASLLAVPDEEIPKRIAFVSDKLFEPHWWQRIWNSGPQLGFVSAAMLSIAILVSAFTRPAPAPVPAPEPGRAQLAAEVERAMQREFDRRVADAVARAVADAEKRHREETRLMLTQLEKRLEFDRRAEILALEDSLTLLRKSLNRAYIANSRAGGTEE
ncbi:MAG: hypothetical protein IRZ15_05200 [Bryobacteraceae bacterium]|nr:hypothetical protein [Bryobacteraceae bacterium]